MPRETVLMQYYEAMLRHFGPSRWWPGDSPFEVVVGAVLTQNTAWRNVEKALALLRQRGELTPRLVWDLSQEELEECLRPSGFFRLKARRLRNVLGFFARDAEDDAPPADAGLAFLGGWDTGELRRELLGIGGVGPETADSILLYALDRPSFVVDAYTRRFCVRHGLVPEDIGYHELQAFFADVLPLDVPLYNEYHALVVRTVSTYCKKSAPRCGECPLGEFLEYAVE